MYKNKKKTILKRTTAIITTILLSFTFIFAAGCIESGDKSSGGSSSGKKVQSVSVSKEPTKTEYFVGEEFSAEGGEITITYADKSSETKAMTDKDVKISEVNTTINDADKDTENKTVTVRYGGKSATFKIKVSYKLLSFTFNYNYDNAQNKTISVRKDAKVERPQDPVRDNFKFDNWYSDDKCTVEYDFASSVVADTVIYAKWLENAQYFNVKFDCNYKDSVAATVQKVKEGDKAVKPAKDPTRRGYKFDGWYNLTTGGEAYNFDTPVTAEKTVYAKWTKTAPAGKQVYTFEAEDTNLTGKRGPGISGTAGGPGLIQMDDTLGASNNQFVGYQYEIGCSLEFQFISDVAVSDATIILRLSAELRDFDIDKESYRISLNGVDLDYGKISFTNVPKGSSDDVDSIHALPFKDYTIAVNVSLKEGLNIFSVCTMNSDAMSGTTMTAKAPLIDCLKIETEAVLDWCAKLGLPKKNY